MLHEYYEISIKKILEMSDEDFLELCSLYLVAALEQDRLREIDYQARQYAREYLDFDPNDDFPDFMYY